MLWAIVAIPVFAQTAVSESRLQLPTTEVIETIRPNVRELYTEAYTSTDIKVRLGAIQNMMSMSSLAKIAGAEKYVVLTEAMTLSADIGAAEEYDNAARTIFREYAVPVDFCNSSLIVLLKSVDRDHELKVGAFALEQAAEYLKYNRDDSCQALLNALSRLVKQTGREELSLSPRLNDLNSAFLRLRSSAAAVEAVTLTAKGTPSTQTTQPNSVMPARFTAAGLAEAAIRGRWIEGAEYLRLGDDTVLAAAGQAELAAQARDIMPVAAGNAWWAAAEKQRGFEQLQMRRRACWWYDKSGELTGLTQGLIARRRSTLAEQEKYSIKSPALGAEPASTDAVEVRSDLLSKMIADQCDAKRDPAGFVRIKKDGRFRTATEYSVPTEIRCKARTDSTNIRLYLGTHYVIFNWEMGPTELRFGQLPGTSVFANPPVGAVPKNQWLDIRWVIREKQMEVYVDDKLRAVVPGNFKIMGTAGIGGAAGSTVDVESFSVSAPSRSKKSD